MYLETNLFQNVAQIYNEHILYTYIYMYVYIYLYIYIYIYSTYNIT